jgi:hypothetical protein
VAAIRCRIVAHSNYNEDVDDDEDDDDNGIKSKESVRHLLRKVNAHAITTVTLL